jgi:hypothetical protein
MAEISLTDWILIIGFAAIFIALYHVTKLLGDIHSELLNIADRPDPDLTD